MTSRHNFRAAAWRVILPALGLFWVGVVAAALSGCERQPDPTASPASRPAALRDTSPLTRDTLHTTIITTDPDTGCQYLGYDTHGLTPRMSRYVDGKQTQMGCYVTEHQP